MTTGKRRRKMDYETELTVEEINNLRDEVAMLKERLAIGSECITKLHDLIHHALAIVR
jgi:hypothetical protein